MATCNQINENFSNLTWSLEVVAQFQKFLGGGKVSEQKFIWSCYVDMRSVMQLYSGPASGGTGPDWERSCQPMSRVCRSVFFSVSLFLNSNLYLFN